MTINTGCEVCKGRGEYSQTYTVGCGFGSYQSMGKCDYCNGTGQRALATQAAPTTPVCANCGRAPGDRRDECEGCPDNPSRRASEQDERALPVLQDSDCVLLEAASEILEKHGYALGSRHIAELLERLKSAQTAQGSGVQEGSLADNLRIEQTDPDRWVVCVENWFPTGDAARAACRKWKDAYPAIPAVKAIVDRFLGWKLPQDFYPDAGISFDRSYAEKWGMPSGTNLFHAEQAKEMFEFCLAASPAPSAAPARQPKGIYVASRASVPARPQMWCSLRAKGWPIVSTWIDEAGEGETGDFTELWQRIHDEIAASRGVILYAEESDLPLKGAFIECGIALGMGKPVAVVLKFPLMDRSMRPLGSWGNHPLVKICQSLDQARRYVESAGTAQTRTYENGPGQPPRSMLIQDGYTVAKTEFGEISWGCELSHSEALSFMSNPAQSNHQNDK